MKLHLREEGEPNQWLIHDGKKWLLSIQVNGELTAPQQESLMEQIFPVVEFWRGKQRLRTVKLFKVNTNKPTEKIERQLELVLKRYFWDERTVSCLAGWSGTDFVDGFITYRIEGYERH